MRTEQEGEPVSPEHEARLVSASDSAWTAKTRPRRFVQTGPLMGDHSMSLARPAAQPKNVEAAVPTSAKRFVPNSLLFLIGLDFILNGTAQALVLADLQQRLSLNGGWQVALVTLLSLLFTM